ncbi:MAG: SEC-C domain-containing protein [Bacteroidales bacterium]|nr:SEC-C domain-containing protein [Bacteroidales bacterium]
MKLEKILNAEYELLRDNFPKLNKPKQEKFGFSISGNLELIDPYNSKIWEIYTIRIEIPFGYPTILPSTFEIGNKIKRIDDNHINKNSICCLAPRLEEIEILGYDYKLIDYLKKLVIPFFATHKLNDLNQDSGGLQGYPHYGYGIIKYYKEKFNMSDIELILKTLDVLANNIKYYRDDPCYCGSGKKFKKCHEKLLHKYGKVSRTIFLQDIKDIKLALNKPN